MYVIHCELLFKKMLYHKVKNPNTLFIMYYVYVLCMYFVLCISTIWSKDHIFFPLIEKSSNHIT